MRLRTTLAILLVTVLAVSCKSEDDSAAVDLIVQPFLGSNLGGVAVAVVRDDRVLVKKGFGPADMRAGVPVTPDTVFDLASIGKQFTGIAALMLMQQGKLSLDDDVRRYVPEVPAFDTNRPIRIGDLSRHRSGLREFPRGEAVPTEADVLSWLSRQTALQFPAGSRWDYCNLNYFILARIVERVSGKTLRMFLEQEVFAPAGMKNAQILDDPNATIRNRATGYCFGKPCSSGDGLTGPGGVFASLDDMIAWDIALRRGTFVDTESLLKGSSPEYGFGWSLGGHDGHRMMWHDGDTVGGSTYIARYLDSPITIILLSNQTRLETEKLERKLAQHFLPISVN
jgi:CubicO group peptidase (beta-lactamase class C family)